MKLDRILSQLLSDPAKTGIAGAVAGGLLASESGRKLGKQALQLGGMAALAGLAYAAWQRHENTSAEPRTPDAMRSAGFLPATASEREDLGRALLRAMIAAARADGRLDDAERAAIARRAGALGLDAAERATLLAEIERPVGIDEVVASARSPQHAAELYAASLVATAADTAAERAYLSLLAARLNLDAGLVAQIHREVGDATDTSPPESA